MKRRDFIKSLAAFVGLGLLKQISQPEIDQTAKTTADVGTTAKKGKWLKAIMNGKAYYCPFYED